MAEFEIRRARRRLEKLDDERSRYMFDLAVLRAEAGDDLEALETELAVARLKVRHSGTEIKRAERRLRALLEDEDLESSPGFSSGVLRMRTKRGGGQARGDPPDPVHRPPWGGSTVTTITTACARCGAPLERPATGRPPTYCGEACRRLTEREIARVDHQLDDVERMITRQRAAPARRWAATLPGRQGQPPRPDAPRRGRQARGAER